MRRTLIHIVPPVVYRKVCIAHDWIRSGKSLSHYQLAIRYSEDPDRVRAYCAEAETGSITVPSAINQYLDINMKTHRKVSMKCKSPEDARAVRLRFAEMDSTISGSTYKDETTITTSLPMSRIGRAAKRVLDYLPKIEEVPF